MLPEQFRNRMKQMLKEEYPAFENSYAKPSCQSLRINELKGDVNKVCGKTDFLEDRVPWAEDGYYYKEEGRPGKHPFHEAGVYYIQEASAMAPVMALQPKAGEKILDLCAAPGGKSTQIAAAMKGQGLLVCNEIHSQRAKILSENIERMGVVNALVTNHEPAVLETHFQEYFDRILVDAPCSGEGMFRKNEEAVKEWSPENVSMCAGRQLDILESAAGMLRPGGTMVYSTCTFAPSEDEGTINSFLAEHPEFSLVEIPQFAGMEPGNPAYLKNSCDRDTITEESRKIRNELTKTVRLWPHKLKGEGHFMACLRKEGVLTGETFSTGGVQKGFPEGECREWQEFEKQYLRKELAGQYLKFGDQLYLIPENMPSLKGLKVLRAGLHLGTIKKDRFEPSHALALSLRPEEAVLTYDLTVKEAEEYLSGQTFQAEGEKGWYLISVEGYSLGWGKLAGGIMKNHYPKGLRK